MWDCRVLHGVLEEPTKCQKDEVLMRNLVSAQQVAVKKRLVMARNSMDLPCKSVRNSPLYLPQIMKLIKECLKLSDIQIKDYRSLTKDMFEKDSGRSFGFSEPLPDEEENSNNKDSNDEKDEED